MLGSRKTSDTKDTGPKCLSTSRPAFSPRTSWPKRVQTVWPRCLLMPWPQLYMNQSRLIYHCAHLEPCTTIWQDLRQNKELVFVSFKKGLDKDRSPATISSWIKQTMILSYKLSDQESLTLHQVKPMLLGPVLLLKLSSWVSPQNRYCQNVNGNPTTPLHSCLEGCGLG